MEHIGVIARTAMSIVIARAATDRVVAVIGIDRVIAGAGIDRLGGEIAVDVVIAHRAVLVRVKLMHLGNRPACSIVKRYMLDIDNADLIRCASDLQDDVAGVRIVQPGDNVGRCNAGSELHRVGAG